MDRLFIESGGVDDLKPSVEDQVPLAVLSDMHNMYGIENFVKSE